ncbi:hypothetical protein [Flavobacterium sp.]|nr:hypothetical protein [Flavobacterium sp.]
MTAKELIQKYRKSEGKIVPAELILMFAFSENVDNEIADDNLHLELKL